MNNIERENYITLMTQAYNISGLTDWTLKSRGDNNLSIEQTEVIAAKILQNINIKPVNNGNSKRYRAKASTARQTLLNAIFKFSYAKPECLAAAECLSPEHKPFYPKWKNVVYIQLPQGASAIIGNRLIKVVASIAVTALVISATYKSYEAAKRLITFTITPFIHQNAPDITREIHRAATSVFYYLKNNAIKIFIYSYVLRYILNTIPQIPYVTYVVNKVPVIIWNSFFVSPQSVAGFAIERGIETFQLGSNICTIFSQALFHAAEKNKVEKLAICKKKSRAVWDKATGLAA